MTDKKTLNEELGFPDDFEYDIIEEVKWEPGDPVTNTGEMLLRADWERALKARNPEGYLLYCHDSKEYFRRKKLVDGMLNKLDDEASAREKFIAEVKELNRKARERGAWFPKDSP